MPGEGTLMGTIESAHDGKDAAFVSSGAMRPARTSLDHSFSEGLMSGAFENFCMT